MIDWTKSMQQTYEFYKVSPTTWRDSERINTITSCSITRDSTNETLAHASFECTEDLEECYIRVYLIATQDRQTEKVPLGTFMIQTPEVSFDGRNHSISVDAYSPLMELKESLPPIGYTILKGTKIMETAGRLCWENMRAPVVFAEDSKTLDTNFVSNLDDTWLIFVSDLVLNAKMNIDLDELGRVLFVPQQETSSLVPVYTYDDGNSSILYPDISDERDLYGIPNVVEVVYSTETSFITSEAINDDPDSPISTVNRGRRIVYRETDPSFPGIPRQAEIDEYATRLLEEASTLEHTLTYTHGYCPVRIGDCVRLNYERSGIFNVKAKVVSQTIKCESGCSVEETAKYTTKLWR